MHVEELCTASMLPARLGVWKGTSLQRGDAAYRGLRPGSEWINMPKNLHPDTARDTSQRPTTQATRHSQGHNRRQAGDPRPKQPDAARDNRRLAGELRPKQLDTAVGLYEYIYRYYMFLSSGEDQGMSVHQCFTLRIVVYIFTHRHQKTSTGQRFARRVKTLSSAGLQGLRVTPPLVIPSACQKHGPP